MNLHVSPDELREAAEPVLSRVAGEIAAQLARTAEAMAEDRQSGLMDKPEAAHYLGIELRAMEDWMKPVTHPRGRGLPHYKFGETVRFSRRRIDAWALKHERNPVAATLMEAA